MMRVWFLALFLLCPLLVFAAETREAIITQSITGLDVTPPTVPSDVDAYGVTQTSMQIDWTASTDNVAVAGYRLWRDDVLLATTTLTSYLDSGLATSTEYTYYVTAFDAAGNQSASSTSVTAETLSPVVIADASTESTLVTRGIVITNIEAATAADGFALQFQTNRYVKTSVRWELNGQVVGVSAGAAARKQHELTVSQLQPATTYTVYIQALVGDNVVAVERSLTLQTDALPDTTPPPNVYDLRANATDRGVVLQWRNPPTADLDRVRIVRSHRFYPTDVVDGWVVFDGLGQSFLDSSTKRPAFYTVFTIDAAGNVSSGAVVAVLEEDTGSQGTSSAVSVATDVTPTDFTTLPDSAQTWPVFISQADVVRKITPTTDISITPNLPFTVYVPASAVPDNLKTIVATLQHPVHPEQHFQFLLRRRVDSENYSATIETLPARGQYNLRVQWFDFVTKTTGSISGTFTVSALAGSVANSHTFRWLTWALGLLLLLLSVRIIIRYALARSV